MMKSKLRWLLLLVPLALFAWAYGAASWRPKLIGVQPAMPNGNGLKRIPVGLRSGSQILISPDANSLAASSEDSGANYVTLWDLKSRRQVWQRKFPAWNWKQALAFSPDGSLLAVAAEETLSARFNVQFFFLDTATGEQKGDILRNDNFVTVQSAAFLSNRELVVSTSQGATTVNTQTGKPIRQWKFRLVAFEGGQRVYAPQSHISANGTTVIALANGREVKIYNSKTARLQAKWTLKGAFRDPRLSPDGKLLALEEADDKPFSGAVWVYDARTGQQLWGPFMGNQTNAPWAWSADSQRLALANNPGVSFFAARQRHFLGWVSGARGNQALALSPDNNFLYTLDDTGKIWRWRAR